MSKILITGASGFLGQALVQAARAQQAEVVAVTRQTGLPSWVGDAGITHVQSDLGQEAAVQSLEQVLGDDVTGVIHAAASFSGNEQTHARDTIKATQHLVGALQARGSQTRLVLVSSLSVYDVAAMDDHSNLDEAMRLVENARQRDAYAAAKVTQETCVRAYQGPKKVIRPGVIFGPKRLWSSHLGFVRFGVVICPGGDSRVPAIDVNRAAGAIVNAALTGQGEDVVNLIERDPPTQMQWLEALEMRAVRVPRWCVLLMGVCLGRGSAWQARFRPLNYDTSRGQCLLEAETYQPFPQAISVARDLEKTLP